MSAFSEWNKRLLKKIGVYFSRKHSQQWEALGYFCVVQMQPK
ncbi:MAG: hypothetical protein PVI40_04085 [Chlamydiota bacterium]